MISFLMMAKNVDRYIGDAISALQVETCVAWELIVVDDHSDDQTFTIANNFSARDPRIRVFKNPHVGKVTGTNFAFEMSSGDVLKCIDSDDIITPEMFDFLRNHEHHDILFHSGEIVDHKLSKIASYHPNDAWLESDFVSVAEDLVSFPKWTWSFNRTIANKIFPLPEGLPFEDVWMSLMCKKYARVPGFTRKTLYLYRQHDNQTYGGILNFSRKATEFRAQRLLKLIRVLEEEQRLHEGVEILDFSYIKRENEFLCGKVNLRDIVRKPLFRKRLALLALTRFFPYPLKWLAIFQWKISSRTRHI